MLHERTWRPRLEPLVRSSLRLTLAPTLSEKRTAGSREAGKLLPILLADGTYSSTGNWTPTRLGAGRVTVQPACTVCTPPAGSAARTARACGPGVSAGVVSVAPHGANGPPSRLHSGRPTPSPHNPNAALGPVSADTALAAAGEAGIATVAGDASALPAGSIARTASWWPA